MSRLLVLNWHNVEGTWAFPAPPGAGLRGLARQLQWLRRAAHVVALQPALQDLAAGRPLPPRAVALTFDDGYADMQTLAAPLLARLGLPATFFLLPGLLDGEARAWWEDLAWAFAAARAPRPASYRQVAEGLKQVDRASREAQVEQWVAQLDPAGRRPGLELFLDWAAAGDLVRQGFAIGSHSTAHAVLSRETRAAQAADLVHAAARLRDELAVPVDVLAYPNGRESDYDATTRAAAAAAGHRFAVTTRSGLAGPRTGPYDVPRAVLEPAWGATETARQTAWWWRALRAGASRG